jgi:DNA polymerase-3 subunit alpha
VTASFAHLHVHTEYSLLDGMSQMKDLVAYTASLGMDSIAITDHGVMYGVIEFYRACKAQGVKPIIGMEAYLAKRGMGDRDPYLDKSYYHLLLLAENQAGYKNLLKIASASQLDGFYYKPRIDHEFLAEHSEGLIATSGCMAAEIPQMILEGRDEEARQWLGWYMDVFGEDRFYIELQEHDIPDLRKLNKALIELAPYAKIPLLATNDVHYVHPEDADPHDVLLCIGTGSLVSETNRLKFSDDSYYLRTPEEMARIFAEVPESVSNTVKIAEMCDVNLDDKSYKLPKFPVPEGYDAASYLRHLCENGLEWRYGVDADSAEVRERLEHELRIINDMGFDTYFLIVWDLCEFARREDIWWNVRGSGAGSVVAYTLGITNIDPLRNSLIFERFLNPGRVSMPDIDLDYPDDRRNEMIDYCVHKYGEDKVAQIITFGTLGARAAVRDVGRTLDIPLNEVDQLARLIPNIPGKPVALKDAVEDIVDLKSAYEDKARPYIKKLLDSAMRLEGVARHASTHACGLLVADQPLVEYTPLHRPTRGDTEALGAVSQWPMEIVESIGLLKVDFLGLRTLTIMRKACELIEHYHGVHFDLSNIPYRHLENDADHNARLDKAFELLTSGNTSGVFQVEGAGMTRMLIEMKPSRFEHIIAGISLFRPGPIEYIPTYIRRMHGEEEVSYHHEKLEPILSETYGIIVYQEQIMQIASELFGYQLGDADLMRRAVAKKKEYELKKHRAKFQKQGPERGVSAEAASRIFDDIEFFARYGFNKSHAADYAILTVQTAYLKAHYPHEYMTALLTIERANTDKVGSYIADCHRMGIDVLPPDVNLSQHDFTIESCADGGRSIRYGLSAIKNVGEGSVEAALLARDDTPFVDLTDFCQRVDLRDVGKRALESMIKVGALDMFADRAILLESLDRLMNFSISLHRAADVGQMSLFGDSTGVKLDTDASGVLVTEVSKEVNRREMLQWERELVGVYISEHPLKSVIDKIGQVVSANSIDLTEADHDRQVTMAGMVNYVRTHTTKKGKPMAFAGLEDLYGHIEVVIWPSTWDETKDLWVVDRVLLVRGKIDAQRGEPKLLCDEATTNFEIWQAIPGPNDNGSASPVDPPSHDDNGYDQPAYYYDGVEDYGSEPDYALSPEEYVAASTPLLEPVDDLPYEMAPETAALETGEPEENGPEDEVYEPVEQMAADNVDDQAAPPDVIPSRPDSTTNVPVKLRIKIKRSSDPELDRRRMQHIHGVLISFPGNDQFSFVVSDQKGNVEIDFSNDTTHYCPDLEVKLSRLVGQEDIQVIS